MRRLLLVVPFVFACTKSDAPKPDASAAPAAAALTDADVSGTWKGSLMPAGSDSVVSHWTQICGAGTCRGTSDGAPDTVVATYTLAGDSSIGVSSPVSNAMTKGATVIDHWVAHILAGRVTGTGRMTLASKPDSVVMAYHFTGSRTP